MEQISRVPQARLVNTYRWKWKARLLASCGAMATSWPSLSTAPSPAARASARRCPTRARRRRLSPAQAGAGLLPLRGPARRSFADRRGAALARPSPARTHSPRPRGAARVPLGSYTSASSRHRPALGLGQHDVLRARRLHTAAPGHHAWRARRRICSARGSVAARPECVDDERVDEKLIIKCGAGSK